jgi:peptidoglycan/xylan/chitin deacetylase (PgdA/CDA1 family)
MGAILRVDNVLRPETLDGFKAIMEVINANRIISVIDVTPQWHGTTDHDQHYVQFVKDQLELGHILALHGVEHRCRILSEEDHQISWKPTEDEFDCKDYRRIHGEDIPVDLQREWLREGNNLLYQLFNQRTDLLMPPAHAFNANTMRAMELEGFKGISDYGRWDVCPYPKGNVTVFPFDFEDYMKNTRPDGSNQDAMLEMFGRYFGNSTRQQEYYATFIHCDFSGDGTATEARLDTLDKMIKQIKTTGLDFVDPHDYIK